MTAPETEAIRSLECRVESLERAVPFARREAALPLFAALVAIHRLRAA